MRSKLQTQKKLEIFMINSKELLNLKIQKDIFIGVKSTRLIKNSLTLLYITGSLCSVLPSKLK